MMLFQIWSMSTSRGIVNIVTFGPVSTFTAPLARLRKILFLEVACFHIS